MTEKDFIRKIIEITDNGIKMAEKAKEDVPEDKRYIFERHIEDMKRERENLELELQMVVGDE